MCILRSKTRSLETREKKSLFYDFHFQEVDRPSTRSSTSRAKKRRSWCQGGSFDNGWDGSKSHLIFLIVQLLDAFLTCISRIVWPRPTYDLLVIVWLLVWCSLRPAHFLEELSQTAAIAWLPIQTRLLALQLQRQLWRVPSDYFMKLKKSYAFDFVGLWKVHRHMLHARVT